MKTLQELQAAREAKAVAITEKWEASQAEGATAEEVKTLADEMKSLNGEIKAIDEKIAEAQSLAAIADGAKAILGDATKAVNVPVAPVFSGVHTGVTAPRLSGEDAHAIKSFGGTVNAFEGESRHEKLVKAYGFGNWFKATQFGDVQAAKACERLGIDAAPSAGLAIKAQSGDNNAYGGSLIPQQFMPDMIYLREQYGKFRQNVRVEMLTTDTAFRPRQTGDSTAYWVQQGTAATESTETFDNVELSVKTLSSLLRYARELAADSAISLGNIVARDITRAHEKKVDDAGFTGTGVSANGNIKGITTRLSDVFTTSGGTGLIQGAGNSWSAITLANLESVAAALPIYAEGNEVKWYVSKQFYYTVMVKLMLASGGVTSGEVARGAAQQFLGYPVEFVVSMPSATASAQVCAILGNLPLAAMLGDRQQMSVETDSSVYFTTRQIAVMGYERLDINVHDVGATGVAGPVVGLITA